MKPVNLVLSKLQNVEEYNSQQWQCTCPAHNDDKPSLSVSVGEDERVLLKCHAGCDIEDIVMAMGLETKDLFSHAKTQHKNRIAKTYDYTDKTGKLLYQTVRKEPKAFLQRQPDGNNGWTWNLRGVDLVLYRLPELLKADPQDYVFICEGEKSADAIADLGLVTTTNAMGAGKWHRGGENYTAPLQDRKVCILPDNDRQGKRHARQIAESLHGKACPLCILELPGLAYKQDPFDWCASGGHKDELLALAEQAPEFQPEIYNVPPAISDTEITWLPMGEIISALNRSETGDAELLAHLYTDRITYDHAEKTWHLWTGHNWERDRCGFVRNLITNHVASQYLHAASIKKRGGNDALVKSLAGTAFNLRRRNRIANVMALANGLPKLALTGNEWDSKPWLLGVANGVLNLQDGTLNPGQPADYIRSVVPTTWYSLDEPSPRWEQFLSEIFADNSELVSFIQRLLGYGITGHNYEHKLVVLYGEGRNGKDTLLETLIHVMGELSSPVGREVLLSGGRNPNAATPHLYGLRPLRLAWVSETNEGARLDAGQVKLLSGGGTVVARPLYGAPVRFIPQYLMMMVTNFKPHASADDYALWKRLLLIPFTEAFVDNPDPDDSHEHLRDPHLAESLQAEAAGILAWLVRGCIDWQVQGLNPPATVIDATEEYRQEEDTLSEFFDEYCKPTPDGSIKASVLYQGYKAWTKKMLSSKPMSKSAFGKRAKKRYERVRRGDGNYYTGIQFIDNGPLNDGGPLF